MTPIRVTIAQSALDAIAAECGVGDSPNETGGILLGHDAGHTVHVTTAGDAGPGATRTPTRFLRDLKHSQDLANDAWQQDQSQWIGEWHTHPGGRAIPSETDLTTYLRHLHDPELGFERFLTVIVATRPTGQHEVTAWVITRDLCLGVPISPEI